MPEMMDSGIEWIGEIPVDFSVSRIKYISGIFGRIGFRGYTQDDLVGEGEGAITLSPSNFKNMKMNFDKCSFISWDKYYESPEIMINPKDILFVKTGSSYGKSCYVNKLPLECTINPQLIVFKNVKGNSKWFSYYLQTDFIKIQSELAVVGGTIPTMSQEKIGNFPVIVPPIEQQNKIVAFLDSKCAEIDFLLSDIQSEIETLEEYKKSAITEAVTKGLNPDVKMKDSGIEYVGYIPSSWEIHPVYYYFGERKAKNYALKEQNLLSLSYGKIIRKDINTNGGLLPASFNTYNIVEAGDIIIRPTDLQNDKRSLRTGLVTEHGIITSAYIDLMPIADINSEYFHYLLHAFDVMKVFYNMGNGVRQGLNYSEFSKLMIFAPSRKEQDDIVAYLKDTCTAIEESIALKKEQLETLEEYKKSVIYEYVTGKKEVV